MLQHKCFLIIVVCALVGLNSGMHWIENCPSGSDANQITDACTDEVQAMVQATFATRDDITNDGIAIGKAEQTMYEKDCTGIEKMVSEMNLQSKEFQDLYDCMLTACGCSGRIYQFGFAIFFGTAVLIKLAI